MSTRKPSLRARLLFDLGFLTSAAVLLVGATTAVLSGADLAEAAWALIALWVGCTAVFVLFGAYLVRRLVVRPLQVLAAEADGLAEGNLAVAPAAYETAEFAELAERYRQMAMGLLDVQSQVVRVEKLAGVGRLAAGVAHEVRNPLGALSTYIEVLRQRGTAVDVAGDMRTAVERIERTVQSLLAYARPGRSTGATDLNAAVQTVLDFLGAQGVLRGHEVTARLAAELPPVRGDRHELEQVVVNLVVNACQAGPHTRVIISTAAHGYDPRGNGKRRAEDVAAADGVPERTWSRRPRRIDLAPGDPGVLLMVADDGPGVAEADRDRIFDPFFTTKDPGTGTGLGLAIVARTVHEAGGVVWVDRAREGGAVFKVFLPVAGTNSCAC